MVRACNKKRQTEAKRIVIMKIHIKEIGKPKTKHLDVIQNYIISASMCMGVIEISSPVDT